MSTMGHKGGIGTASGVLDGFGTVGVLLLCNFGGSKLLRIGGVPVGETITAEREVAPELDAGGSCIGDRDDRHPARRPPTRAGRPPGRPRARAGSVRSPTTGAATSSSPGRPPTAGCAWRDRVHRNRLLADKSLDAVFTAVVDASEEAVTNALFVADTVTGVDGHTVPGLPVERVLELVRR